MRLAIAAATLTVVLMSCAAGDASSPGPTSPATLTATALPSAAATPAPTEPATDPTASPGRSPAVGADLVVDELAEVLVDDLSLRAEPATAAERIGLLPIGEPAYVVAGPVEADGYQWYQLASVREPYRGTCGDPAPEPSLECAVWFGWAAGVTPDGDRWLGATQVACPAARDTDAYLSLLPAERLACAGSDEWRLRAYVAPESGGRGCYPVYVVDPGWLDPSCNFSFLQPEESQYDSFEDLQVFVHPDVGTSPFEALKGSWVEVTGSLDHPASRECTLVVSSNFEEAPYPPPSAQEEVVFRCRTRFVVTDVEQN